MMDKRDEIVSNLTLELRRGTLILSVLSQLFVPQYGYSPDTVPECQRCSDRYRYNLPTASPAGKAGVAGKRMGGGRKQAAQVL